MKLYYTPHACSMACHIALRECRTPFELKLVKRGENRSQEHLAVHADGLVPVMEMADGARLTEAAAILLCIAAANRHAQLLPPTGTLDEARVFEWLAWLTNTMHIAYALHWRPRRFTDDKSALEALKQDGLKRILELNRRIESRMTGAYAVSDSYTLADPYLFVFYSWNTRIGIDASTEYPRWTQWAYRISERPAVSEVLATESVNPFSGGLPGS